MSDIFCYLLRLSNKQGPFDQQLAKCVKVSKQVGVELLLSLFFILHTATTITTAEYNLFESVYCFPHLYISSYLALTNAEGIIAPTSEQE